MNIFLRQWQVGYRMKPAGSILSDKSTPFIPIPNTPRYTAADPFLFTKDGTTYLFAELFDKIDNRGKLGYCVFDGLKFGGWKMVISESWHLSYPNIFEYAGDVYIVPEANGSNEVYCYKAVSFPDKWEKCGTILRNGRFVDTTFLEYNGRHYMFTYDISDDNRKKLLVYDIAENSADLLFGGEVSVDDSSARPGGCFFEIAGKIVRVSQDCDGDYGKALVFSELIRLDSCGFDEKKIDHISPSDIVIEKSDISGIHTYNGNDFCEVIDFHCPDYSIGTQIGRVLCKIRK